MARLNGNNILAKCPYCDEALSNFEPQASYTMDADVWIPDERGYSRHCQQLTYQFYKCTGCHNGGMGKIYTDTVTNKQILFDFYPKVATHLSLPGSTPSDIESEFRSAENCAGIGEYRPAGAMLRSTLEKILKDHGYKERYLSKNIKNAADDGVLTLPLKKRAVEVVKALGDEILHEAWKEITAEKYENSCEYTQRVIECFYDAPEVVKEILVEKKRVKEEAKKTKEGHGN